jgi:hypothetical protein
MRDDDIANWDAAYVLGALSPEDRLAYEDHLAAHPERAAAMTEFAGLPGILNALSPEEAVALIAEPDGRAGDAPVVDFMPSLARAAERRQKRSRRAVMATVVATAAVFLAVGVFVATTLFPRTAQQQTPTLQAMAPGSRSGVVAALAVSEKKWGTRLDWKCEYTKDWARNVSSYDLVVTTDDGKQTTVGSWAPEGDEATGLAAATVIPTSKIRTVDIRVAGTTDPLAVTTLH